MNIQEIYTKYFIPLNLQEHMYRVAAVGSLVSDSFPENTIDKEAVVKTLLLHDMGNILKFDFSHTNFLIGEDKNRVEELKKIKEQFKQKYSSHADEATLLIMKEIGVDQSLVDLCHDSHGDYLPQMLERDNWEQKICYYSDMRVGPHGVLSMDDRFGDLKKRYAHEIEMVERNHRLCRELEKQLNSKAARDISYINDDTVRPVIETLKNTVI